MGQRANYILKTDNSLEIHYSHWRANCIASDLYLGEQAFLSFVSECKVVNELLDPVWMEGCVVIDRTKRELCFWSHDVPGETSTRSRYLALLATQWPGWRLQVLENRMYDAEKVLGIDYRSRQELPELRSWTKERIEEDEVSEWTSALVLIKDGPELQVLQTGDIEPEIIIAYGAEIIPLLAAKPKCTLPKEGDRATGECLIIDTNNRRLFLNQSHFGLWEKAGHLWPGYDLQMGDVGYLDLLSHAQISTEGLAMDAREIAEQLEAIFNQMDDGVDPYDLAGRLLQQEGLGDIQFNPDFFDTARPRSEGTKSGWAKWKKRWQKFFRR